MAQNIYRNIFFKKNIIQHGTGDIIVYYTGHIYGNAESLKDFKKMYDRTRDLYIQCSDCAAHKYNKFLKKN